MKIGLIGLGKMGFNLALNLIDHEHQVVAFDVERANVVKLEEAGATGVNSLKELAQSLAPKRVIWLMIPAGQAVDDVLRALKPLLQKGDIIIDGGNSNYKDTLRRYDDLRKAGLALVDCGTSGGISGARKGACTMVGGDREAVSHCEKIFEDLSVQDGYLHVGGPGAGHFIKMVHNGIEYGMMQAIAEGFAVVEKSPFNVDFHKVARLWNHGSVIRSWLIELCESAFGKEPRLESIKGVMHASGEGLWTIQTALELGVPTPVIALSLIMRQRSLETDSFAGKVVAALRAEFGGHAVVSDKSTKT
ncbi:MAG: decarboxylating 6-phosphogluconate dehydrogenase [Deltaproteobacteria bacterium]|nr:decarboxylating 6-phosphogluconate dehydrogenase [Deltaproteobacteria bacterium]